MRWWRHLYSSWKLWAWWSRVNGCHAPTEIHLAQSSAVAMFWKPAQHHSLGLEVHSGFVGFSNGLDSAVGVVVFRSRLM